MSMHLNTEAWYRNIVFNLFQVCQLGAKCRAIEAWAKVADLLVSYNAVERLEPQQTKLAKLVWFLRCMVNGNEGQWQTKVHCTCSRSIEATILRSRKVLRGRILTRRKRIEKTIEQFMSIMVFIVHVWGQSGTRQVGHPASHTLNMAGVLDWFPGASKTRAPGKKQICSLLGSIILSHTGPYRINTHSHCAVQDISHRVCSSSLIGICPWIMTTDLQFHCHGSRMNQSKWYLMMAHLSIFGGSPILAACLELLCFLTRGAFTEAPTKSGQAPVWNFAWWMQTILRY